MKKIIEVKDLYKSFGEIKAVNGIDFFVEEGKLFAFLGPNGAGKSTTIDIAHKEYEIVFSRQSASFLLTSFIIDYNWPIWTFFR